MARTPERQRTYMAWYSMICRCTKPRTRQFEDYGGRGITVCPRWLVFDNFLSDMGHKPAGLTLERIDNDKGYYPNNCRWATRAEQVRNRRNTIKVVLFGEVMCLKDATSKLGAPYLSVLRRMKKGMGFEEAVTDLYAKHGYELEF